MKRETNKEGDYRPWLFVGLSVIAHLIVAALVAVGMQAFVEPEKEKEEVEAGGRTLQIGMVSESETESSANSSGAEASKPPESLQTAEEEVAAVEQPREQRPRRPKPPQPPEPEQPQEEPRQESPEEPRETAPKESPDEPEQAPEKPKPTQPEQPESSEESTAQAPPKPKVPMREKSGESEKPKLPVPTMGDHENAYKDGEAPSPGTPRHKRGPGSGMFAKIKENKNALKETFNNFDTVIKPGNHTSVPDDSSSYASYINHIHNKIHPLWGDGYLMELERNYGPGHPLSNSNLNTELELVVDGKTGKLETINIVESSGETMFDSEAITVARTISYTKAPSQIVSHDGNVYLHWNFWRNQRQCGVFGVSIYKLAESDEEKEEVRSARAD